MLATGRFRHTLFTALYLCARTFERTATLWFYAAAGAARLADLRAGIRLEWDAAAVSHCDGYDALGLMGWERDFYLRFLKPDDRVLVVGCGAGRDLLALLDLGYRAEGVDVSPRATTMARGFLQERGREAPIYTGAIETVPLPGLFDAFIFAWFCYSYIPESGTRVRALRKLSEHLNPGGRILVTYAPATRMPRRLPIQLTRFVAWLSRSDWRPEYGDFIRLADDSRRFEHYEHQFTREGFEEEARAGGLTVAFHDGGEVGLAVLTT
jgi:SAM-dependent methyltransferase